MFCTDVLRPQTPLRENINCYCAAEIVHDIVDTLSLLRSNQEEEETAGAPVATTIDADNISGHKQIGKAMGHAANGLTRLAR